jgi:hypothetical protein
LFAAEIYLRTVWIPLIAAKYGTTVGGLYLDFLGSTSSTPSPIRVFGDGSPIVEGNSVSKGFRDSVTTQFHFQDIRSAANSEIITRFNSGRYQCNDIEGNKSLTIPIKDLVDLSLLNKGLNWDNPFEIPGVIAGGSGSGDLFPDTRNVTGSATVNLVGTSTIDIEYNLRLEVFDTIDFAPGDLAGGLERLFTVPALFLEVNDRAYDVPFQVDFNAKPVTETFTLPNLGCHNPVIPKNPRTSSTYSGLLRLIPTISLVPKVSVKRTGLLLLAPLSTRFALKMILSSLLHRLK